ncbi:recombinase family protein [Sphingobacterium faecium]|uniref:recombinase family protein n=1 Tax=Sphingobacterium faecium TaxID=34087 RepID=UPI0024699916|nr:recombinase family protein [Sphingobacterium faecium]MDH5828868.1 recombinase family protein [Sphingobacterium faecium]WGQ17065.1 recombinase family protein [Sphingobacterium faecium]
MIFAYARVSSREQSTDAQVPDLEKFGFDELVSDKISGKIFERKGLEELRGKLRADDVLLVWRLDRLGRSMLEVLNLVAELKSAGVHLVSLKDGVDTRTPIGNLMLGLMASLAEYEFTLLKERQRAGIDARKLKGLPTGRPKGLSPEAEKKAILVKDLYDLRKYSITEIMRKADIKSRGTIYKYLRLQGVDV